MPHSSFFAAHFSSVASAVQNLNALSFVRIHSTGVADLPEGILCGIAPMDDNSAAVIIGGSMSPEQRLEAFHLLDRVAHVGLVVSLPPGEQISGKKASHPRGAQPQKKKGFLDRLLGMFIE